MTCNSGAWDHLDHLFTCRKENHLRNQNMLEKKKERERIRGRVSECSQGARYSHLFILMEWFVSSGKLIILPEQKCRMKAQTSLTFEY